MMYLDKMLLVYLEVAIMILFLFKLIAAVVTPPGCIPPVHHFLNISQNSSISEM